MLRVKCLAALAPSHPNLDTNFFPFDEVFWGVILVLQGYPCPWRVLESSCTRCFSTEELLFLAC